ncbi:MAG TPA: hypothetical protein VF546_09415 [Pyrinomonadaceae bacterium]|jgi:hypothetical protein
MSDNKQAAAELILKLYDLRREETMRKARNWIMTFNPDSIDDIIAALMGENNAYFRQVTSYWEMAAALVNHGAIDEQMFHDANGEHLFVYAKFHPFIKEMRERFGPHTFQHLERLCLSLPDAEQRLAELRERARRFAALRAEQAQAKEATA